MTLDAAISILDDLKSTQEAHYCDAINLVLNELDDVRAELTALKEDLTNGTMEVKVISKYRDG